MSAERLVPNSQSRLHGYVPLFPPSAGSVFDHHVALGYLLGPTLGSTLFSLTHPSLSRGNLEVMDRELFARIRRNRVDPSFQSVNNPAPDFYGEKVGHIRRKLQDGVAN
jgi:hypothetical protein